MIKRKEKEIVFCWNNCSGYSQEKCFKCNLVFPKLSRLKKGQGVKVFEAKVEKRELRERFLKPRL